MCILPIFLCGSECWAVSNTDVRTIEALNQWCLRMLLGIKWYHFVWNDDVRRQTKQPKLTAIIQAHTFTILGHTARIDDNADDKRIMLALPQGDWRRPPGRPLITWLSTILYDLRCHNLTLPEAVDMAQNRPVWRLLSFSGATQSWVACHKRIHNRICRVSRSTCPEVTAEQSTKEHSGVQTSAEI